MNEEEKKARAFLRFYVSDIKDEYFDRDYHIDKNFAETILNLIEKQQKEIENYQILKDDIDGHRIVYVDTPEFEENYISKDKVKEIKEKYKKERSNMTQIIFSKFGKTQQTFNQAVVNEVIKVLDEILGE